VVIAEQIWRPQQKTQACRIWTIFEEASGNTLYWRSGMKAFKELREGEDNE